MSKQPLDELAESVIREFLEDGSISTSQDLKLQAAMFVLDRARADRHEERMRRAMEEQPSTTLASIPFLGMFQQSAEKADTNP